MTPAADGRSEWDKMVAGELYRPSDPHIQDAHLQTLAWLARYNAASTQPAAARRAILVERLAAVGEGSVIRPPFHCDYGTQIHLGRDAFLNFNCVILDITTVTIGDGAQIGPGVQIYAADHPRDPALRERFLEFGRPVRLGAHCWIGGGSIILPGVTVGDGAIVGAGSVVTRDVPPGSTVAGNPARRLPRSA